jgi:hypothetical protein
LYPRNSVDDAHVSDLTQAVRAGATLPPVIADRKSLRIVDGMHRRRAIIRVHGDEASHLVELRDYEDDAALFLDAVQLNAEHGRKLDRHDQVRIVLRLRELRVEDRVIAASLHLPEERVQVLALRVVYDAGSQALPSKRGLEHLRGTQLTPIQVETMQSVRSAEAGRLALELTRLLQQGLVNMDHPLIVQRLHDLHGVLRTTLKQVKATA